jgi:hypothetical protein
MLTLVVVPVALTLLEDMARKLGFGRKARSEFPATTMLRAAE